MINFLIKLFVKNHQDVENEKVRNNYGFFSGVVGILTNGLLVTAKMIIGFISGSMSIIADAINNLSDGLSSIITIIGFRLASKEADDDHPFGHQRIEYISSFIISIAIMLVGLNFVYESIKKIIDPVALEFTIITIVVLAISILFKIWQALFYKKISERISSTTLKASSKDSFNDCLVTGSVLVSVIVCYIFGYNIDGWIGIIVSFFILKSGYSLIKETCNQLIGELPSQDIYDKIVEISTKNEFILGYHDLVIHTYGPRKMFASIHLEFDYRDDILKIHDIIDNVEKEIMERMNIQLVVHMDPTVTDDEETRELSEKLSGMIEKSGLDVTFHDFRIVRGITHTNVLFDVVIPANLIKEKANIKRILTTNIKEIDERYEVIIDFDIHLMYKS